MCSHLAPINGKYWLTRSEQAGAQGQGEQVEQRELSQGTREGNRNILRQYACRTGDTTGICLACGLPDSAYSLCILLTYISELLVPQPAFPRPSRRSPVSLYLSYHFP